MLLYVVTIIDVCKTASLLFSLAIPLPLGGNELFLLKGFLLIHRQVVVLYFFLAHSCILHHLDVILEYAGFCEVVGAVSASVVAIDTEGSLTGPPLHLNLLLFGLPLLLAHSFTPFLHL